jgi:hypothetical protein
MRHYSAAVPNAQTVYVSVDTDENDFQALRLKYLEPNLDGDTPASDRVREAFRDWYFSITDKDSFPNPCANASFVYSNLNTGAIVVFVAWYGYEEYAGTHFIN